VSKARCGGLSFFIRVGSGILQNAVGQNDQPLRKNSWPFIGARPGWVPQLAAKSNFQYRPRQKFNGNADAFLSTHKTSFLSTLKLRFCVVF
jgi:hypothetical protein